MNPTPWNTQHEQKCVTYLRRCTGSTGLKLLIKISRMFVTMLTPAEVLFTSIITPLPKIFPTSNKTNMTITEKLHKPLHNKCNTFQAAAEHLQFTAFTES